MITLILIVLIVVLVIFNWYMQKTFRFWERKGIPDVHIMNPYKNLLLTVLNRVSFADQTLDYYNARPDKSVYGVFSINLPILFVKDPDMLRQIMIKDFDYFTDHIDAFLKEENDTFFGKNLFALKGKRWHAMRTTMSPAFTGSKMRQMFELMRDCGEQLVKYFDHKFDQMTNKEKLLEMEFLDVCTKFTNDVIMTVAMGIKVDSLANPNNQFYKIGQYVQNFQFWRFMLVSYFPRLTKLINLKVMPGWIYDFFRNTVKETIQTRERENIVRPDMIHILNEARKGQLKLESEKSEEFAVIDEADVAKPSSNALVLTEEDIVAQAFLFFIAGFGNVALMMAWASYELALNPDVQNKLYKEIQDTLENCHGKLTYDALMKMKYLDMVATETLRKWPPLAMTNRQVTKPYKLKTEDGEINLETGMYIGIPVIGLHRDPKYYPNPERFDPERFIDQSKIHPFAYLPFGNGPRICIGSRLTLLEVKVFLVYMLSKFEFTVIKKTPIPPILKNGTNLELAGGFWLGIKRRNVI